MPDPISRPARRVRLLPITWPGRPPCHAFAVPQEAEVARPAHILGVFRDSMPGDGERVPMCPCEAVPAPSRRTYSFGDMPPTKEIDGRVHFDFGGALTWDEASRDDLAPTSALWFLVPQVDHALKPHTLYADVVPDEGFVTDGEATLNPEGGLFDAWRKLLRDRGLDPERYHLVREEGGWRITRRESAP